MSPLALARQYMAIVYEGGDLTALLGICAPDLRFAGPFAQYDSAQAYVADLRADPPDGFGWSPLHAWEDRTSACLVYQFSKKDISTPMAQIFETNGHQITAIRLIFDTQAFSPSEAADHP